MAITLTIAGVTRNFKAESLNIVERQGSRSTCDFTLESTPNSTVPIPDIGAAVVFTDTATSTILFAGTIESPGVTRISSSIAYSSFSVTCVDYQQIADRRNAGEYAYSEIHANDVVLAILANSLNGEGITAPSISAGGGPVLASVSFRYPTVTEALDAVASLASTGGAIYKWKINYSKELEFFDTQATASGFTLTDSTKTFRNLEVHWDRTDYANRVVVLIGQLLTAPQTQTFNSGSGAQPTDGTRTTWTMNYPVSSLTSVKVNGVSKTIGASGETTGSQWYWTQGSSDIQQDSGEAVLTTSDSVEFIYVGLSTSLGYAENTAEQTARAAVEGGTGVYYKTFDSSEPMTQAEGDDLAAALLNSSDSISRIARFETDSLAIKVGDFVEIDVTGYSDDAIFYVREVSLHDWYPRGVCSIRRRVECVVGPIVRNAADVLGSLGSGTSSGTVSGVGATGGGGGSATAPAAPTSPTVTVVPLGQNYNLTLAWTLPGTAGGEIGWEPQIRYFSDSACLTPTTDWTSTGLVMGAITSSATVGPFNRPNSRQYILFRVRSFNADADVSSFVTSSAGPYVDDGSPTQPGAGDWSVTISTYRNDAGGVRYGFMEFTVATPASDATIYSAYVYRGNPPSSTLAVSSTPSDYVFCATSAKGSAGFTFGTWEICAVGAMKYWVVLCARTNGQDHPPDSTSVSIAKSVTLAAQGAPLAPTVFSATTTFDDGAGLGTSGSLNPPPRTPGVPSVKVDFTCTFVSDPNRNYAEIQRRYASNGAFNGTTTYTDWGPINGNISANDQTAHTDHPTLGWLDVSLLEWGQMRLRVFDLTGALYVDCATILNYTWSGGLLQLSQADPDSLGKGITVSGGQIKTTASDSNNLLLNPGFDYGTKDWNISGGSVTALTGISFALTNGTLLAILPTASTNINQRFDVRPGDPFYIDAWVKADGTMTSGSIQCGLQFFDNTGSLLLTVYGTSMSYSAAMAAFVRIFATTTAPASSSYATFFVSASCAGGGWYLDNVYASRQPQADSIGALTTVDQGVLLTADAANGGFNLKFDDSDTLLLGWTVPSTSRWSVDTSNGVGSGNCMKITSTSSVAEGAFNLFQIKAANGQKFTARAWSKASGFTGTVKIRLTSYNAAGSVLGTNDGSALSATGSIVETSDIITLSAGATTAYIVVEVLANTSAGTFYVDNISVARTADANDIAPAAIDYTKIAAGYQLTNVGASLPTLPDSAYPDSSLYVLTTDHKIYRNVSGTWTKTTSPADLTAGTIAAGVVYAGDIQVDQLTAGTATFTGDTTFFLQYNGTCNTSGTSITRVTGPSFFAGMVGRTISINGTLYTVATYSSASAITTTVSAGTHTGVTWFFTTGSLTINGSGVNLDQGSLTLTLNSTKTTIDNGSDTVGISGLRVEQTLSNGASSHVGAGRFDVLPDKTTFSSGISIIAGLGIEATGYVKATTDFWVNGSQGFTGTVVLKGPTSDGSLTVKGGIITARVNPT